MITNAERDHIRELKQWFATVRVAHTKAQSGPFGKLLRRLESHETVARF